MKTKALILLLIIGKVASSQVFSNESILFSQTGITGTARTAGSADAYGSVGADMGSLDINPAGLGLFRSSEFCITPGLVVSNNKSNYEANSTNSSIPRLVLNQAGIEWTKMLKESPKSHEISFNSPHRLRSITFALNYQSQNFFLRSQNYGNPNNTNSSLIDNYASYLNYYNISPNSNSLPPEAYLALQFNLLTVNPSGQYVSNAPRPVMQQGDLETRGSNSKINIGFGGNLNDKLYFGLGLSVPFITYTTTNSITEINNGDSVPSFQSYNLSTTIGASGYGVTGNLGLIYRPVNWLRLGAAYHLPTWYSMSETYTSDMSAIWDSATTGPVQYVWPTGVQLPGYNTLNYTFRTPMRGVFSASFFLKKIGFLSVDYQIQNMAGSHYNFGHGNELYTQQANDSVKAWYTIQHTLRVGIEGAYKILRLRAGYAFTSSPYNSSFINYSGIAGYTGAVQNITAGVGLRFDHFYIDFAYICTLSKDVTYNFGGIGDNIYNNSVSSTMLLTVGWKLNQQSGAKRARSNSNNNNTYTVPPTDQSY